MLQSDIASFEQKLLKEINPESLKTISEQKSISDFLNQKCTAKLGCPPRCSFQAHGRIYVAQTMARRCWQISVEGPDEAHLGVSWVPALRVISAQVVPSGTSKKRRTSVPGWKCTVPNLAMKSLPSFTPCPSPDASPLFRVATAAACNHTAIRHGAFCDSQDLA